MTPQSKFLKLKVLATLTFNQRDFFYFESTRIAIEIKGMFNSLVWNSLQD